MTTDENVERLVNAAEAVYRYTADNQPERIYRHGWKELREALDGVINEGIAGLSALDSDEIALAKDASATSRAAAIRMFPHSGTQRRKILEYIMNHPSTDDEIITALGMNPNSARPRRGELADGGWVKPSGVVRPTKSGSDAIVWEVTDSGWRAFTAGIDMGEADTT